MAKVSFYLPDGGERTFRLFTDRALRVGRDPGNDAVIRDAKVSRRHAEIIFERGFFVIHDLGSANGTYVNGRRVRIAPLTDGSELRVGATLGRFSEDAQATPPAPQPREILEDEHPSGTVAMPNSVIDFPARGRRHPPPEERLEPAPDSLTTEDEVFETRPHRKGDPPLPRGGEPDDYAPETVLGRSPDGETPPRPEHPTVEDKPLDDLDGEEFSIESSSSERSVVRNADAVPLLYFRRPGLFATFLAGMIALTMIVAGFTTAVIFFAQGHGLPAIIAVALTVVFTTIATTLVPPRNIELYRDEEMTVLAMTIWQESRSSFPRLRYCARTDRGVAIAYFHKSLFGNAGRRRWWIFDETGDRIGCAVEDSLLRALLRKIAGSFSTSLTTDFLIEIGGRLSGMITRRAQGFYRSILSLYDRGPYRFDPRIAVALAVLIESIERR